MNETTISERARRGQALILVTIALLAVVATLALASMRSARINSSPIVQDFFWRMNGHSVTTATVGDEVQAHIVVKATQEYVGSIILKIRKDFAFWPDKDYSITTVPIELRGDQATELEVTFTPDKASVDDLRGYFAEVDFLATHTKWVTENSYPPRLRVSA